MKLLGLMGLMGLMTIPNSPNNPNSPIRSTSPTGGIDGSRAVRAARFGPREIHSHHPPQRRPSELRPSDKLSVASGFIISKMCAPLVHSLSTLGDSE